MRRLFLPAAIAAIAAFAACTSNAVDDGCAGECRCGASEFNVNGCTAPCCTVDGQPCTTEGCRCCAPPRAVVPPRPTDLPPAISGG
jgi:hypothetical protein